MWDIFEKIFSLLPQGLNLKVAFSTVYIEIVQCKGVRVLALLGVISSSFREKGA